MDLALPPALEARRSELRQLIDRHADPERVRALERSEWGYSPELWRELDDAGWLGAGLSADAPEDGLLDWVVLAEELGRAACPLPLQTTAIQCGLTLQRLAGADEAPRIAALLRGDVRGRFALLEPSARWNACGVELRAEARSGGWTLHGTKRFVSFARSAQAFLVAVRSGVEGPAERGVSLLWVEADRPGVQTTPLPGLGDDAAGELVLDGVRVDASALIGAPGEAWPAIEWMLERATTLVCAEMVGGMRAALEYAVGYTQRRVQFEHPIARFQAVQHRSADMLMDADAAQLATYEAASRLIAGRSAQLEVSLAKIVCGQAYGRVTASGQQVLGGVGFYADQPMGAWFRRARALAPQLGDVDLHRERVARLMEL